MTLLECLRTLDCALPSSELRTRLAHLRLDAARVLLPIVMLSAGERIKAALACALWRMEPARMLLLDEPTNHLDLDTTPVLQSALQGFGGALIVASHDEIGGDYTFGFNTLRVGWVQNKPRYGSDNRTDAYVSAASTISANAPRPTVR